MPLDRSVFRLRWEGLLLTFAILVNAVFSGYRAATQSIIHDEAFTYFRFVSGPWSDLYTTYDANNHILYSILARFSTGLLGVSEFSLRLPSVLAGCALIAGVFAVARVWQSVTARWLAVGLVCLHPLVLDFAVAARGYGLSLTLLVWGLYAFQRERQVLAGLLWGLAISAHLIVVFPVIALVLSAAITGTPWRSVARSAVAAGAVAGVICYLPLKLATRAHFNVGAHTVSDSLFSLTARSIRTSLTHEGLFGTDEAATRLMRFGLPACLLLMFLAMRKTRWGAPWMLHGTLILSALGLVIAHTWLGVLYPADRTGLWLTALFFLAWARGIAEESHRWLKSAQVAAGCVLVIQFVTQVQTEYFNIWAFDRETKHVAQVLKEETRGKPDQSVTVSVSVAQYPALEFYRVTMGIAALKPLERRDDVPLSGADYYLLTFPDVLRAEAKHLKPRFEDPLTGMMFASESGR